MNPLFAKLSPTITNMIRTDHTHVLATFHQYEADTPPGSKRALVDSICVALEIHAQLEEEIFYPVMRTLPSGSTTIDKNEPEHDEMRRLIAKLRGMEATHADFDRTVMELMRGVIHHVAEEETVLLHDAERLIPDRLSELGAQMTKRRFELVLPRSGEIANNMMRATPIKNTLMLLGLVAAGGYAVKRSRDARS